MRKSFWTSELLKELRVRAKTMSLAQLQNHFGKTEEEIVQAIRYEQQQRLLKLKTKKEKINGKTVKITIYQAAFAEGSRESPTVWGEDCPY